MNNWRHIAEKWNRLDEAIARSKWLTLGAFGFCITLLAIGGFFQVLFLLPENVHFIRQSDSWAFSAHYLQFQNPLLEPAVYNLARNGGKAACEFPLLYWVYGKLYAFFQFSPVVPRLVSLGLNLIGLCALFAVLAKTSKSILNAFVAVSFA